MGHVVRRMPWGTMDVDTTLGRVFFQQTWSYTWVSEPPLMAWTYPEKHAFHTVVDRQIWRSWSFRVVLGVTGTQPLASRFGRTGMPINFDVRWMPSGQRGDWRIQAVKTNRTVAQGARSSVTFSARTSILFANDTTPRGAQNEATPPAARYGFLTMPHEFGHMIGLPDEYTVSSPDLSDADSIMNIGRYVRVRHMVEILRELGRMFPGCVFTVRSVR